MGNHPLPPAHGTILLTDGSRGSLPAGRFRVSKMLRIQIKRLDFALYLISIRITPCRHTAARNEPTGHPQNCEKAGPFAQRQPRASARLRFGCISFGIVGVFRYVLFGGRVVRLRGKSSNGFCCLQRARAVVPCPRVRCALHARASSPFLDARRLHDPHGGTARSG